MKQDLPKNVSVLYRKMCVSLNVRFEHIGLSTSQTMVLICLNQWGSLTQADLCRKLDMDKGAIAKTLMRLDCDGFVTRRTNPDDVRAYLVSLTDKAKDLIPQIERIQEEWVDALTSNMTSIERDAFIQLFQKATETAAAICE